MQYFEFVDFESLEVLESYIVADLDEEFEDYEEDEQELYLRWLVSVIDLDP
jgi:hypothetical protein